MEIKTKYYVILPNGTTIEAASKKKLQEEIKKETVPEKQSFVAKLNFPIYEICDNSCDRLTVTKLLNKLTGKQIHSRTLEPKESRYMADHIVVKFWIGRVEPITHDEKIHNLFS